LIEPTGTNFVNSRKTKIKRWKQPTKYKTQCRRQIQRNTANCSKDPNGFQKEKQLLKEIEVAA
jgi:hypothetical protein